MIKTHGNLLYDQYRFQSSLTLLLFRHEYNPRNNSKIANENGISAVMFFPSNPHRMLIVVFDIP